MILLNLFWSFFQIGLFSFGGGYAALPMIQALIVDDYHWLNMTEFADIITISQMTPGPIALNAASFVGTRIWGLVGAVAATIGCVLPSCVIVLILAMLYKKFHNLKYMQGILQSLHPAVIGMIASAGLTLIINSLWGTDPVSFSFSSIDFFAVSLITVCLTVLRKTKISPIFVMLGSGAVGGLLYSFL